LAPQWPLVFFLGTEIRSLFFFSPHSGEGSAQVKFCGTDGKLTRPVTYLDGCEGPIRTEFTITLDTVSKRARTFRSVSLLAKTNSDRAILAALGRGSDDRATNAVQQETHASPATRPPRLTEIHNDARPAT